MSTKRSSDSSAKPATDFSEFHEQQLKRMKLAEEQDTLWKENLPNSEEKVERPARAMSEEEARLWEGLIETSDESNDGLSRDGADGESMDEKFDEVEWMELCEEHMEKRKAILESGKEDNLSNAEFDSLHPFDRERVQIYKEYEFEWNEEIEEIVHDFLDNRIDICASKETVAGYKWLKENMNPTIAPDIYYLSLWSGSANLREYEKWALFGL